MVKVDLNSLKRDNLEKKYITESLSVTVVTDKELNLMTTKITEDETLDRKLCEIALKIHKLTRKSRLQLGELFQEAYDKLGSNNRHHGVYTQWLKSYNFNKMTAIRYRVRWNLYKEVSNPLAKELIESLPQKDIEIIDTYENKVILLDQLNKEPHNFSINSLILKDDTNDTILIPVETSEKYHQLNEKIKTFSSKIKKIDLLKLEKNKKLDKLDKILESDLKKINDMIQRLEKLL